jgi:hypothetical protein
MGQVSSMELCYNSKPLPIDSVKLTYGELLWNVQFIFERGI